MIEKEFDEEMRINPHEQVAGIEERAFQRICKDERIICSCSDGGPEDAFKEARTHYHHCILAQACRAITITKEETLAWVREELENERKNRIREHTHNKKDDTMNRGCPECIRNNAITALTRGFMQEKLQ